MSVEGIGEAVAGDQGAGDATHLPAELEVVFDDPHAEGVRDGHGEHADQEAGPEDAAGKTGGVIRVEEGTEAGEHWFRF